MRSLRPSFTALLGLLIAAGPGDAVAEWTGDISIGWRSVSVDGSQDKYDHDVDLDDGLRLFAASGQWRADAPARFGPDVIDVSVAGLGGEPFAAGKFVAGRTGQWRFSAERRRSDYRYSDILVLPEDASIEGSTGGDFHRYAFERVRDRIGLDVTLSSRTSLFASFERNERSGDSTTTIDIQRDEFEMERPVDDELREFRAGFRYRADTFTVYIEERLRRFESDMPFLLDEFSPGLTLDDPAVLDFYALTQSLSVSGNEHVARVTIRPMPALSIKAGAILGDHDLSTTFSEEADGIDFEGQPFTTDQTGAGNADRDTQAFDLDVAYAIRDGLRLEANVATHTFDQTASSALGPDMSGESDWQIDTRVFGLNVVYAAGRSLIATAGWRDKHREVDVIRSASDHGTRTHRETTDFQGFHAAVTYRPINALRLRMSLNDVDIDDPYTLATATGDRRYRLQATWSIDKAWSLGASHSRIDRENPTSVWSADTRQTSARIAYSGDTLSMSLGLTRHERARQFTRSVTNFIRTDVFEVRDVADAETVNATLAWRIDDRWTVGGAWHTYDNDGTLPVSRDDRHAFAQYTWPTGYSLRTTWREIDYTEDNIEAYDASILEVALNYRF